MPAHGLSEAMSPNKKIIEAHLTAPSRSKAADYLADDVEWIEWGDGVPPTGVRTRGKDAFVQNYGDDEIRDEILRMTEENNVVVVEGVAHVQKKDGRNFAVRYINLFELEHGKIQRKTSFGALLKDSS
jgi:uncharacterized protein